MISASQNCKKKSKTKQSIKQNQNKTKIILKSLHVIFPFARRGYAPDLSDSLSTEHTCQSK